ncbi:Uncharacterised protein [Mycobacteroides abscessus subsp. abscessus]|nr:Uncharacterised protein [Mycobacteroides abscessus subsp. abscessus]
MLTTRPPSNPSEPRYAAFDPQNFSSSAPGRLVAGLIGSTKVAGTDCTAPPPQPLVMVAVPPERLTACPGCTCILPTRAPASARTLTADCLLSPTVMSGRSALLSVVPP